MNKEEIFEGVTWEAVLFDLQYLEMDGVWKNGEPEWAKKAKRYYYTQRYSAAIREAALWFIVRELLKERNPCQQ